MALKHLITCVVAGIDYLVHPQILGSVEESVRADQIIPVVVLSEKEVNAGPEELWDTLHHLVDNDDVCTDEFTGIIVVSPSASGAGSREVVGNHDASDGYLGRFSAIYHLAGGPIASQGQNELPSGPYFLSGPNLHQAWRLYPDDLEAFTFGLIPEDVHEPHRFQAVTSQSSDGFSKTIPVPSRFYHRPDEKRPLAGARISLGDTLDAEGVKTTLSSRAWAELYPAADASAAYVRALLGLGAVVVGKTKTTQLAAAGGADWVDAQSPANPRGDRYQGASGSSAGAAASLAGYGWLDYAVGGDSIGGVREPAAYHGLYAIRPTIGSASLEGVRVNSPRYDTIGLLGRGLDHLVSVVKHSLDVPDGSVTLPRRIIYPTDFFPLPDPDQQKLVEDFVGKLEGYLGVRHAKISLAKLWQDKPPAESDAMQSYMEKAPFWSLCYDYYRASDHFRSDYHNKFDREPFVEATPALYWGIGANVTSDEYDTYLTELETFRTWFDDTVMSLSYEQSDDAILVLPCGSDGPNYRDSPPDEPTAFKGIDSRLLSPILGTPEIVVPFAQLPYKSRVTRTIEYRPVCISLMGSRGSDLTLLRLAEETLRTTGWRTHVDTGRYTFPVGLYDGQRVKDKEDGGGHDAAPTKLHADDAVAGMEEEEPLDEL
ncbi:hypothetical protein VPNG_04455 [Cytospora leucostoma]|uniref:Amidase domain-containing protein n=1 Tax=Cytospora leucostoma TaxID=1230097 RepID=A0A423XC04_9PEZI|nr:hypothetical protein VPNG_04455 [Cytospora leucostoma]